MKKLGFWLTIGVLASVAAVPAAHAGVLVLGAGSSAMWQTAAIGAYLDLAGSGAHHYTIKGKTSAGNNYGQLADSRSASIPAEGGNLWVVWSSDKSKIWAYLSVDSVVGNRAFFAAPRAKLQLDSSVQSTAGLNLISSALFKGTSDDKFLDPTVYAALNNATVTTAFTDIRPEDAKAAQTRVNSALNSNLTGLGYNTGNPLIGTAIESAFSTAAAHPIEFNLTGSDPFTKASIPAHTTISVGAEPIVFLINRTDVNGLGKPGVFKDITTGEALSLFNGSNCNTSAFGISGAPKVAVNVVQREPLSGTMNTTEYTNFRLGGPSNYNGTNSQEANVGEPTLGSSSNPLNKACLAGGGKRERAIGTGEEVNNGVYSGSTVTDAIGYAFFSYGNVSKLAGTSSYGYLVLNGVDPINITYSNGDLPTCTAPCPATSNPVDTFHNLRNGSYRSWSVLRVATDAQGTANYNNTSALVSSIQAHVDSTVPDFVPYKAVGTDPGLKLYRSHYPQAGYPASNGLPGGTTGPESGGDVGGCIETLTTGNGVLNCHQ